MHSGVITSCAATATPSCGQSRRKNKRVRVVKKLVHVDAFPYSLVTVLRRVGIDPCGRKETNMLWTIFVRSSVAER
jgi:hypothetical protein